MNRALRWLLCCALFALCLSRASEELAARGHRKGQTHAQGSPSATALPRASVWSSHEECLARVNRGERLAREPGRARLAAWNVRWFPDGAPGRHPSAHPTDVEWLACALSYLDVDVVALEEIKAYPRARQKLDQLIHGLNQLTNGDYRVRLDDCEPDTIQHVALLWNAKRAAAEKFQVVSELNPRSGPCEDYLRPGLSARFRFPGGLDLTAVAVHLKSGGERRAAELRVRSLERLPDVLDEVVRDVGDDDLLLLGDFNTMGCKHCSPSLDADAERRELAARLGRMRQPFRVVPTEPGCSHFFDGKPGLLDLVVAPRAMRELDARARVVPSGLCAELACGRLPKNPPAAYRELSDHCPIVVDLVDQDLD